ncbi:ABC transporter ATP-binding protein [Thermodesulfobacteriota bacterium]
MTSDDLVLKVHNIETYYGNIMAIKGISIDVQRGHVVSILGANGAGKTTILRTISGVLVDQPEKGTIELFGQKIERQDPTKIAKLGIGHVPEGRETFPELTTEECLKVGYYNRKDKDNIQPDLDRILGYFPVLGARLKQRADMLSGGEQQMLAISVAMMTRPKLLMMDEPSLGLSPLFIKEIFKIIKMMNDGGTTILLVEQNARVALNIAHFGYVLENGRIVLFGSVDDLKEDADVKDFFLGMKEYDKVKSYKRKKKWS